MSARRTNLGLGIEVASESMPNAECVSLGLYFPTGSRHETRETNGSAHFIEHLIFKGTRRRNADAVNREIDCLGGGSNAFTSKELVCLHSRVLAENLARAFDLLADLASEALPDGIDAELERERGVILSEIRSIEDSPEELVAQLGDAALYGEHPLAFPIAGSPESVADLTLPALQRAYRERLVAGPLVVAAAGGVDHDELVALVRERLGDRSRRSRARASPPDHGSGQRVLERDLEQVQLSLLMRGLRARDPRWAAAELLCVALGDGYSSRLFREIRERRGLAYSVGSSLCSYADTGSLNVELGVEPARLAETLDVVSQVLASLRDRGLISEELDAARQSLRAGLLLGHESSAARMAYLANLVLQGETHLDLRRDLEVIERVGLAEVNELAAELLDGPIALAAVGPIPAGVLPGSCLELAS
jgi:predicted Zn-dependent peptidase